MFIFSCKFSQKSANNVHFRFELCNLMVTSAFFKVYLEFCIKFFCKYCCAQTMLAVVDVCGGILGMSGWFVSTVCTCFYFFQNIYHLSLFSVVCFCNMLVFNWIRFFAFQYPLFIYHLSITNLSLIHHSCRLCRLCRLISPFPDVVAQIV